MMLKTRFSFDYWQSHFLTSFLGIAAWSGSGEIHVLLDLVIVHLTMELVGVGWKSGLFMAWEGREESIFERKQNVG